MPRWFIIMLRVAAALRPATRLRRRLSLAAAPTQLDGYWSRQIETSKARGPSAQRPPSEQRPRLPPREPRQTYQGKKNTTTRNARVETTTPDESTFSESRGVL